MKNNLLYVKALTSCNKRIKCSISDYFVSRAPIPVVFFYSCFISLEVFVGALEKVLSDFSLFAGAVIKKKGQLYIDCVNQGVPVRIEYLSESIPKSPNINTLATHELVDSISSYQPLKNIKALLTIRLRYYSDGMTMGFCWHHLAGDMATFMSFLKALSSCASNYTYQKPLIVEDRELFLQNRIEQLSLKPNNTIFSRFVSLNFFHLLRFIKNCWMPKKYLNFYFDTETITELKQKSFTITGKKLSRNDVICAYILSLITKSIKGNPAHLYASIVINYRKYLGLDNSLLGNFIDLIPIQFNSSISVECLSAQVRDEIENYQKKHFSLKAMYHLMQKKGWMNKWKIILPIDFFSNKKNLIISNWCNFGMYSIDYGQKSPYLIVPLIRSPLPWFSFLMEGRNNEGILLTIVLPRSIARRLVKIASPINCF